MVRDIQTSLLIVNDDRYIKQTNRIKENNLNNYVGQNTSADQCTLHENSSEFNPPHF